MLAFSHTQRACFASMLQGCLFLCFSTSPTGITWTLKRRIGKGARPEQPPQHYTQLSNKMSIDSVEVTRLKLKVSNRESGLLEWRPCACSISQDRQLVLEPSVNADSDDEGKEVDNLKESAIIRIDLASQLQHIELKKKNKARCEFTYSTADGRRASQELMAPSTKICQQWVECVREAQQHAQRQASIRKGAIMAQSRAASVSPLPKSLSADSASTRHQSNEMHPRVDLTIPSVNLVKVDRNTGSITTPGADNESSTVSSDPFQPGIAANNPNPMIASMSTSGVSLTPTVSQLKQFQEVALQERRQDSDNEMSVLHSSSSMVRAPKSSQHVMDFSASHVSSCSSSSSSSIIDASHPGRFMASERGRMRATSDQLHCSPYSESNNDDDDGDSHDLLLVSPRSRSRVSAAIRRQRLRLERRQQERDTTRLHHRKHYIDRNRSSSYDSRSPCFRTRGESISSSDEFADSLHGLRVSNIDSMTHHDNYSNQDLEESRLLRSHTNDASSKSELRMLVRVEEVLRQLEQENAERKQREEALAAQVQSLRDALRVKSAEREHVAREFRVALRDKEKWQQSAQSAERMANQLREELAIAREEVQLLARDKLRLKRQNGELLAQVHRLDSLVYGRF